MAGEGIDLEIYKVQLPLATNSPIELALFYNKSRSREGFVPVTEELRKAVDKIGDKELKKAYIIGYMDHTDILQLFPEAPVSQSQDW